MAEFDGNRSTMYQLAHNLYPGARQIDLERMDKFLNLEKTDTEKVRLVLKARK